MQDWRIIILSWSITNLILLPLCHKRELFQTCIQPVKSRWLCILRLWINLGNLDNTQELRLKQLTNAFFVRSKPPTTEFITRLYKTPYAWMDYLLACCSSKANWSKGYEIFRIALSVVENNEDRRVSLVINYRLVQNLRSRRVLRWRNHHTRVALTILPDQDPSKVHEATAGSSPCVGNWVGCISGKLHAAS